MRVTRAPHRRRSPTAPSDSLLKPRSTDPQKAEEDQNSGMPPMPTAWWLRPVSSAALVGEHIAVTWKRL